MSSIAARVAAAAAVFASTNIDDLVVLSVLFAAPGLRPASVVAGQLVGVGALVAVSAAAGMAAVAVPPGWTSLLGAVPLGIGVVKLVGSFRSRPGDDGDDDERAPAGGGAAILLVSGITIANGGDNLSVYIPIFAADRSVIPIYVAVFACMTGLWCGAGYALVRHRAFGARLRRHGHAVVPVVLIVLGAYILAGAAVLVR